MPRTRAQWYKLIREIPGYDPFAAAPGFALPEKACYFDPAAARKAIDFFETRLHHVKGPKARQPFLLERWQRAVIANLFGWIHRETGLRRYRELFLFVPRKNGKTPMAAGIILYMLAEDGEYGAEVYGAASTYKQACLVFAHARGMVNQDPELNERCQTFKGQDKSIEIDDENAGVSIYRVVCSDSGPAHGWNSSCAVIDELHTQPNSELLDAAKTSTGARAQPLLVTLSTSDYERPDSVCNEKHDRAIQIRDGTIHAPMFLPVIYEAKVDADWHDREVWEAANPNLGVSVTWEYIETAYTEACENAANENVFKRLHLNIRTAQDVRLITKEAWDACAGPPLRLADFAGCECWSGLDLAATQDLIAWVLVFKEANGTIALIPILWLPKQTAEERVQKEHIPYLDWARAGHIRLTDGGAADYAIIRRDINAIIDEHKLQLRDVAADRLFQGAQLCSELLDQDGLPVTKHGQGHYDYAAPMKHFMELLGEARLRHGGHPVLAMHAANLMAELDAAGNMKPNRKNAKKKIDGMVGAIMGVGRAMANIGEPDPAPSVTVVE